MRQNPFLHQNIPFFSSFLVVFFWGYQALGSILNLAGLAGLPPVIFISASLQENRFVESYDPTVEDCYEKQIEINGLQVNRRPVTHPLTQHVACTELGPCIRTHALDLGAT